METDDSLFIETHIRTIDDGPNLQGTLEDGREIWTGDKSWIYPGEHTVVVVCEAEYPWSKLVEDVPVTLELKKGYRYKLKACFDAKNAFVEIEEFPHLTHGFFWTR
jgi:hypothetical protein